MSACVCNSEPPAMWSVEVSSGQGSREVKTILHLSDQPPVEHIVFDTGNLKKKSKSNFRNIKKNNN